MYTCTDGRGGGILSDGFRPFEDEASSLSIFLFFLNFFFGAPKNIYCFNNTIYGCDGGNRTRNIAVNTVPGALATELQPSQLSYNRHD
jgi:hypothetical protein